ncbi:FAD binding domain-containing protein [Loa loa]|uniref:Methionine synthase reductase n=1 Tax=Loa loa TaxID=7209 RepID=A0A1I7VNX5_LOALO|nr:FAD binding domain-containing protein [Loa loa]EFO27799.1 FAD binding domain-containing protein [Loa loa]
MDVYRIRQLCLEEGEDCREDLNGILKSLEVHPPKWPEDVACLVRGTQKLQDDLHLRVPVAKDPYLNCEITCEEFNTDDLPWQNGCSIPGAFNQRYQGRVVSVSSLTSLAIQKPKKEIVVDLEHNAEIFYEPGDAFYFIVPNTREEVDFILERMGFLEAANRKLVVTVKSQTTVKNAALPPYIPEISTLRYIFTWCLDIRRSPGRPLLRVLAERTESECQKRRILELCSAQGVEEFTKFVRQAGLSLVDFLLNFPSCKPTVERLIELLPRLLPRPYSVSCIREFWGKRIRFIFSLLHFNATGGRRFHRFGLSSGWLATLKEGQQILMFLKESSRFRLPPLVHSTFDLVRMPLIMVCTGTALAPFLSFLQKLEFVGAERYKVRRELYFGFRNIKDDCIHYKDILRCVDENILSHVSLCESQAYNGIFSKKYVQDALQERGREISDILSRKNEDESHPAVVFVCGSSKQMLKDVADVFLHIFNKYLSKSKEEAESFLKELRKNDQYVEDIW